MTQFALVIGLGKTGFSVARYLQRQGIPFVVFDTRETPPQLEMFREHFPDVRLFLGHFPEVELAHVTRVICSPGVSLDIPLLKAVRAQQKRIESDIDCFAAEVSAPVVAITGTNGKSTVTTLVGEIAKAAGKCVGVAGNIGTPVLDMLGADEAQGARIDLWVLELSSFQLELTHALKLLAATFLNLSDDHLDRHHDMASYRAAKQQIYQAADVLLFNRDCAATYPDPQYLSAERQVLSFGKSEPKAGEWGLVLDEQHDYWLAHGTQRILAVHDLKIHGIHNALNVLAALALADAIGLPLNESVLRAVKNFQGLPHRCQTVRTLDGVPWINDSKGTNVGSTEAAIDGIAPLLQGKLVLILGGQGKGADFRVLREAVSRHVRLLILIGEDASKIEQALGDLVDVLHARSMPEVIALAREHARSGDAVLLSPACASFDWFKDFNHRGEAFTKLVEAM